MTRENTSLAAVNSVTIPVSETASKPEEKVSCLYSVSECTAQSVTVAIIDQAKHILQRKAVIYRMTTGTRKAGANFPADNFSWTPV